MPLLGSWGQGGALAAPPQDGCHSALELDRASPKTGFAASVAPPAPGLLLSMGALYLMTPMGLAPSTPVLSLNLATLSLAYHLVRLVDVVVRVRGGREGTRRRLWPTRPSLVPQQQARLRLLCHLL